MLGAAGMAAFGRQSAMGEHEGAAAVTDPMDRLGHMLIRAYNGDGLDPFFVSGHPSVPPRDGLIVRACFYYAVLMTPKLTVLYDNFGAGGMCTLGAEEVSAVWRTPELLGALGVGFEALKAGTANLAAESVPAPAWRYEADLETEADPAPPGP